MACAWRLLEPINSQSDPRSGNQLLLALKPWLLRFGSLIMKVKNSLKSLRGRHRNNVVVRRKGRVYIINKTNRRFKARQG